MNSIQLANKVWEKVRGYTILEDFHIVMAVEKLSDEDDPEFVRTNALRRVRQRHEELKQTVKQLKETPQHCQRYQILLNKIGSLTRSKIN